MSKDQAITEPAKESKQFWRTKILTAIGALSLALLTPSLHNYYLMRANFNTDRIIFWKQFSQELTTHRLTSERLIELCQNNHKYTDSFVLTERLHYSKVLQKQQEQLFTDGTTLRYYFGNHVAETVAYFLQWDMTQDYCSAKAPDPTDLLQWERTILLQMEQKIQRGGYR
jgi:hypothetical protein